jgi:hypothetical protein
MIGQAIYTLLSTNVGIKAIVDTRIYPMLAEQFADMPYIVYRTISKVPNNTKGGGRGFDRYRVQIDCVGTSFTSLEDLADKVRTAIDDRVGTYGAVTILGSRFEDTTDLVLDFQPDSERVYQKSMDFIILAR